MSESRTLRVSIAGPKGGCGKTFLASSLGHLFARSHRPALIVDPDPDTATLATMTGLGPVEPSDRIKSPLPPYTLLEAGSPLLRLATSSFATSAKPIDTKALADWLGGGFLVIDHPPGQNQEALEDFSSANLPILVTTPDPGSIELCYRFLRKLIGFRLKRLMPANLFDGLVTKKDLLGRQGDLISVVREMAYSLPKAEEELRKKIRMQTFGPRLGLVVNMTRSRADQTIGPSFAEIAKKFFGVRVNYLGQIPYDEQIVEATSSRSFFIRERTESETAACMNVIERNVTALSATDPIAAEEEPERIPALELNHYELLNAPYTATESEIESVYLHMTYIYSATSRASYGAFGSAERERIIAAIQEAYDTLIEPQRREKYDRLSLGIASEADRGRRQEEAERSGRLSPLRYETPLKAKPATTTRGYLFQAGENEAPLKESGRIDGTHLRNIRIARGATLEEIAESTKIKKSYLEAIEENQLEAFPAPVFLKGFLRSYSKALGLNPDEILEKYLSEE